MNFYKLIFKTAAVGDNGTNSIKQVVKPNFFAAAETKILLVAAGWAETLLAIKSRMFLAAAMAQRNA